MSNSTSILIRWVIINMNFALYLFTSHYRVEDTWLIHRKHKDEATYAVVHQKYPDKLLLISSGGKERAKFF